MERTNGKRIAIVTGSALGLGYELTRQLIDRGWFVAGIDFNAERQTELAGEFPRGSYRGFVGDVSDEDFVKASVAEIAKIGHIDLLINNAGQPSFKTPTAYEAADVDKCLKRPQGHDSVVRPDAQGMRRTEPQNRQRDEHRRYARQRQRIRVLRHQMG